MNADTKFSRHKMLALATTTLLLNPNAVDAAHKKKEQEQTRMSLAQAELITNINAFTGRTGLDTVIAITGGSGTDLSKIEQDLQDIETQLDGIIPELNAATQEIEAAAISLTESAAEISATATELEILVSDLATQQDILAIEGEGFISANNSLVAISQAIAGITPQDLSAIEGNGFTTEDNSLVAITNNITVLGNSALATAVQANQMGVILNDIEGEGFISANNSLVAISQAIAGIAPQDLSAIEGDGFTTEDNSLVAITNDILAISNDITAAVLPLATTAQLDAAVSPLATTAQLNSQTTTLQENITTATNPLATTAQLTSAVSPLATTAQLNSAVAPLATSEALSSAVLAIEGDNFDSSHDSLHNISNNTISVPFATTADLQSFQDQVNATLANIENAVLSVISKSFGDPVKQVISAKSAAYLTVPVTSNDTNPTAVTLLANYNSNISFALTTCTRATNASTQSYANTRLAIDAVDNAIIAFDALATQWANEGTTTARPSSTYSAAQIAAALVLLSQSLEYQLNSQSEATTP